MGFLVQIYALIKKGEMDSLHCKSVMCLSFEHCIPFGHSVTKRTLEMVKEVSRKGHRHGQ